MPNKEKRYLDLAGLTTYHEGVVSALNEKAAKPHIGDEAPTSAGVDIWLDTNENNSEAQVVNTYSMRSTSEELTFNETAEDEELTFNDETEEELTFNETAEDEELTFNE